MIFDKPDKVCFCEIVCRFVEVVNKQIRVQGDVVVHGVGAEVVYRMKITQK